jgi:hypothetical protein
MLPSGGKAKRDVANDRERARCRALRWVGRPKLMEKGFIARGDEAEFEILRGMGFGGIVDWLSSI